MGIQCWEMTINPTGLTPTVMLQPKLMADDVTRMFKQHDGIALEKFLSSNWKTVYVIADIKKERNSSAIDRTLIDSGLFTSTKHTSVIKL
ncbi:hypothetical protein ACFLWZ_04590 [Chloroflexota bacterium]